MALPAIIGLPWLAGIISAAVVSVVTWIIRVFSKKILIKTVLFSALAALVSAFYFSLDGLFTDLSYSIPSEYLGYVGLFLPSGYKIFISVILSAHILRWALDWKTKMMIAYIS